MLLGQSYQGELHGWYLQHAREKRNAYNILVQKPEGRRPVWRPKCRWEDDNRM
jgi:hypothetical protein